MGQGCPFGFPHHSNGFFEAFLLVQTPPPPPPRTAQILLGLANFGTRTSSISHSPAMSVFWGSSSAGQRAWGAKQMDQLRSSACAASEPLLVSLPRACHLGACFISSKIRVLDGIKKFRLSCEPGGSQHPTRRNPSLKVARPRIAFRPGGYGARCLGTTFRGSSFSEWA